LKDQKINPKKKLGQHFLKNKKVIKIITSNWEASAQAIIEIGPGKGVLTKELYNKGIPYYAIEKDLRLKETLQKIVKGPHLIFSDALKFDYNKLIDKLQSKKIWLVSNLPYNISVPLILCFLKIENIKYMTLMVQKEVAERIIPLPGKKNTTGSLMALVQTYFFVEVLTHVSPGSFDPPPKITSTVLSLKRKSNPIITVLEIPLFEKFLRILFRYRRKQIGTVLKNSINDVTSILNEMEIPYNQRAETLSLDQVQKFYYNYGKYIK
jgi:16S rRNA (adenine1518-N6/adenine1519-N6)-dimethyltransferase